MKAVIFREPGGSERLKLEEPQDPRPAPGEVLLRVAFCGVNPLDRIVLSGGYPAKPIPHILGSEIGGRVADLGEGVGGWVKGQEVVVYNRLFDGLCLPCRSGHEEVCERGGIIGVVTQGGYAEYVAVPAANLVAIPEGAGLEACTAATLSGLTAWHAVLTQARAAAGEWVTVYGATGGVGSYAVQLANLAGAHVVAVTRDAASQEALTNLGAEAVVVGEGREAVEGVRRATGGRGADVVIDPVGRATFPSSFAAVAPNGRWVTCGALTGPEVGLNLSQLYQRQVSLIGSTGGSRRELSSLLQMIAHRGIGVPIASKFPLKGATTALRALDEGGRIGKVLLEIG